MGLDIRTFKYKRSDVTLHGSILLGFRILSEKKEGRATQIFIVGLAKIFPEYIFAFFQFCSRLIFFLAQKKKGDDDKKKLIILPYI